MTWLVVGLILFLGSHSIRIFADPMRDQLVARLGAGPWRGIYSLVALAGLILICISYGGAERAAPGFLWPRPVFGTPLAALFTWGAFVLIGSSHGPLNHVKTLINDPMVTGVGLWSAAHVVVHPTAAGLVLFGGFLGWSVIDLMSLVKRRALSEPADAGQPKLRATLIGLVAGTALWALFAFFLHHLLFGVSPFGAQ